MSQNPYSPDAFNTSSIIEAPRTSLSAIASLVKSLICCIPGAGILATLFGAISIVRISSSNGRKCGRMLAFAGIVIGLLVTAIQVAVLIGAVQVIKNVNTNIITPMKTAFTQLEQGQLDGFQALLDPKVLPADAQGQTKRFWAEVTAEMGAFQGLPEQGFQFQQRPVKPGDLTITYDFPAKFANGIAQMELTVDPQRIGDVAFGKSTINGMIQNIAFRTPSGKIISLIPPTPTTPTTPATTTPPTPSNP